jgi:FeS assembly SUF system regulator
MIRVTKLADYGTLLLTFLANHPENTYSARDIAQIVHLPLPVVSKVLKLLGKAGILVSQRGAKGGYHLGRNPKEITIAAIVRALEGPIAVTECTAANRECGLELGCATRSSWHLINDAIQSVLENISLAEVAMPSNNPISSLPLPGDSFAVL